MLYPHYSTQPVAQSIQCRLPASLVGVHVAHGSIAPIGRDHDHTGAIGRIYPFERDSICSDNRLDWSMQSPGAAEAPSDVEGVLSASVMRQLEDVESRIARIEVTQTEICAVLDPLTHGAKLCHIWNA